MANARAGPLLSAPANFLENKQAADTVLVSVRAPTASGRGAGWGGQPAVVPLLDDIG